MDPEEMIPARASCHLKMEGRLVLRDCSRVAAQIFGKV
jgi:hypothetical protein